MTIRFVLFKLISLLSVNLYSTNYFVSSVGSNNDNGLTLATAFTTIQYPIDQGILSARNTVYVADGSYFGFDNRSASGTAGQPIVFKALGNNFYQLSRSGFLSRQCMASHRYGYELGQFYRTGRSLTKVRPIGLAYDVGCYEGDADANDCGTHTLAIYDPIVGQTYDNATVITSDASMNQIGVVFKAEQEITLLPDFEVMSNFSLLLVLLQCAQH